MFKVFKQYKGWLVLLLIFATLANGLALIIPRLISKYLDAFSVVGSMDWNHVIFVSIGISALILVVSLIQFIVSTYLSEKVGMDLRATLISKLKGQSYAYISEATSSKLLTNMTSDIDAVKNVSAQGLVSLFSASITFFGVIILLFIMNWKLALLTCSILPFLVLTFALVFGKLGVLFKNSQENLEKINKVINESIIAAPLVRVLNAGASEVSKFEKVNQIARDIGLTVVKYFSALIPVIMLLANTTTIIILWFGGKEVIAAMASGVGSMGSIANATGASGMTLGELSAFFTYSMMFIWPIFVLSFTGQMFQRAAIAYGRIKSLVESEPIIDKGTKEAEIKGDIEFKDVHLELGNRAILQKVSFAIKAGTRNAIVGPTAAGKTQLFYLLSGLIKQNSGQILIDNTPIEEWKHGGLISQIGLVFQDSIIFNTSLRENVDFRKTGDEEAVRKALRTAELGGLVETLPKGLDSKLNERGTNLSGGQKQRLMLARALAQNPKVLMLDDFTARVDIQTEQKIIENISREYPEVTLISITQKIDPIKEYDQVIVLMEGEVLDMGRHEDLINRSVEYKQIYQSQQKAHE